MHDFVRGKATAFVTFNAMQAVKLEMPPGTPSTL